MEGKILKKMLIEALEKDVATLEWRDGAPALTVMVNEATHRCLVEIKNVLENDKLSDFDCIDQIIEIYASLGLAVSYRHDFG
jgi:hypothetical protein